jgi:hypothetical protein
MSFFLGNLVYSLESPADGGVELGKDWRRNEDDMPGYKLPNITGGVLRAESIELFNSYAIRYGETAMAKWAKSLAKL